MPLALWLTLGKEYLKQNNERNFEHILREGTSQEALDYFAGDPTACVAMLEARGAFHLAKARAARPGDAVSHRAALEEASRAYNTAISLQRSAGAYCGLGYVDLAQGEAVRAVRHFSTAASLDRRNALPLLGLAAAYFHEGRYKTSLGKYREVCEGYHQLRRLTELSAELGVPSGHAWLSLRRFEYSTLFGDPS